MSSFGFSRPRMTPFWIAIKGYTYTDTWLAKYLVSYIRNLPVNIQYIFWTKLAGAHYWNKAVQFLNDQNISFVPKYENPLNTTEIRCIEDFWGLIKGEIYKDGWEADNLDTLVFIRRWYSEMIIEFFLTQCKNISVFGYFG